MSETITIPCGYGHKIVTDTEVLYTSHRAVEYDLETMMAMLSIALNMLSELLDMPVEDIAYDLYNLSGRNMMLEAFNSALKKNGTYRKQYSVTELQYELLKLLVRKHMNDANIAELKAEVRGMLNAGIGGFEL
jgi:hypothetical protein